MGNMLEKKVYKSKKALDQANKAKGELGKKKRILKYLFDELVKTYQTTLNANEVNNKIILYGSFFKSIRDLLIHYKKQKIVNIPELLILLCRDMLCVLFSKEEFYFDSLDKFKNYNEILPLVQEINSFFEDNKGFNILLTLEEEIELMSFFDGKNIFERADKAIEVSKWCLDILADILEELKKPCNTG